MCAKIVLNEVLSSRRKQKNLNQKQISKILKLSERTYRRKEAGNLDFNELMAICDVLELKIMIIPVENIS